MKTLLNKTLLRDLQDWKITNRESGHTIYLQSDSVNAFLRMQGGRTHKYKFETPATRKANRICAICDYVALSSAFTAFCLVSYNLIAS
jgi:hypothetical protein